VDGRIIDKRTARRQRAVILAAKALAKEDGEPDAARAAAIEAHDLANDLVPAAVVAGRLLARQGDIRRAARVLETAWKAGPHPEIADAYLHVRSGDSATDRLKRAETLFHMRPHGDEGRHAVARAALDARDFSRAREMLTPLVTERPTQKALILMAELEEAETGDSGRARGWLSRAVYAPRDPVWTADGVVLEEWAATSPATGNLDAVEWKVPVAELEGPKMEIDAAELLPRPATVIAEAKEGEPTETPAQAAAEAPAEPVKVVTVASPEAGTPPPAPAARSEGGVAAGRERVAGALARRPVSEPPRPDDPGVVEETEKEGARALPSFLSRNGPARRSA
ncbi:MAG: heme biosynthesis protein HemY, partial [Propylenella sp.]